VPVRMYCTKLDVGTRKVAKAQNSFKSFAAVLIRPPRQNYFLSFTDSKFEKTFPLLTEISEF
jgi:hypothetical protein